MCQAIEVCTAAMWIDDSPSHCYLLSECTEVVTWDESPWPGELGASVGADGLLTWVKTRRRRSQDEGDWRPWAYTPWAYQPHSYYWLEFDDCETKDFASGKGKIQGSENRRKVELPMMGPEGPKGRPG